MYTLEFKFDLYFSLYNIVGYDDNTPEINPRLKFNLNNNVCTNGKQQTFYIDLPLKNGVIQKKDIELKFNIDSRKVPYSTCLLISLLVDENTGFHEYTGSIISTTYIPLKDLSNKKTNIKKDMLDIPAKNALKESGKRGDDYKKGKIQMKNIIMNMEKGVKLKISEPKENEYDFTNASELSNLSKKYIDDYYKILSISKPIAKKIYSYHVVGYVNNFINEEITIPFPIAFNTRVKYIPTIKQAKDLIKISIDLHNMNENHFIESISRQFTRRDKKINVEFQKAMIAALHSVNLSISTLPYEYDLNNKKKSKTKIRPTSSFVRPITKYKYNDPNSDQEILEQSEEEDQLLIPDFGQATLGFDCEDGANFCRLFIETLILNREYYEQDELLKHWIMVLGLFEYVITVNYCGDVNHQGFKRDINFQSDEGVCHVLLLAIPKIQFFNNLIKGINFFGQKKKLDKKSIYEDYDDLKSRLLVNLVEELRFYKSNTPWLENIYVHNLETTNFATPTMVPVSEFYNNDEEKTMERYEKIMEQDEIIKSLTRSLENVGGVDILSMWNLKLQNINLEQNNNDKHFFIDNKRKNVFDRLYGFYLYLISGSLSVNSTWQLEDEKLLSIIFSHDLNSTYYSGTLMQNFVLDKENAFIVPNSFYKKEDIETFQNIFNFSKPIIFYYQRENENTDYIVNNNNNNNNNSDEIKIKKEGRAKRYEKDNQEVFVGKEAIRHAPKNDMLINNKKVLRKNLKKYLLKNQENNKKFILFLVHESFLGDYFIEQFKRPLENGQMKGFTYSIYTVGNNEFYKIKLFYDL